MAEQSNRNLAAVPTDGRVPQTSSPAQPPAGLDANGFDPTEFEWRPVPRRPRRDGWTPEVQQRFIEALARTGVVERACEAVNMSVTSAYNLRNSHDGDGFSRAWRAVLARASRPDARHRLRTCDRGRGGAGVRPRRHARRVEAPLQYPHGNVHAARLFP